MADNPFLKGKVPARYKGEHEITLAGFGSPYFDAEGNMLQDLRVRNGDTLYITTSEAFGDSWLHDPARQADSLYLGLGRKVKMDHADLSDEALLALGYEWHKPRPDFETLVTLADYEQSVQEEQEKLSKGRGKKQKQQESSGKMPEEGEVH